MAEKPINILETRDMSRHYGGVIALSKVSMQIHPNQISSLIGPNGAGKTTLFNCVTGLDTPTLGKAYLSWKTNHRLTSRSSYASWDCADIPEYTTFFRIDSP